ncbi:MAG: PKD domain-containing protein, partial [Acetatifactor sp.]|nr:PKD domain-containing protein [Acetatifactor sp.]
MIIALLPISDFQNCLSVKAQEASDVSEASAESKEINVSEGDVGLEAVDVSEEPVEPSENRQSGTVFAAQSADAEKSWTLSEDYTLTQDKIVDSLVLTDGTLDLNGCSLTVQGDLIQAGGVLFVNGGALTVEGDYLVQSEDAGAGSGILQMTNAEDIVHITGSFISDSDRDSTGYLTAGIMEVEGDFIINSTYSAKGFIATESHKLILSGEESQKVHFGKSGGNYSRLCNLEISNSSREGVSFESSVTMTSAGNTSTDIPYVTGSITDNGQGVTGFISIGSNVKFTENYFGGSIYVGEGITFNQILTVGGDLKLDYNYDVNISGSVTVKGNLLQSRSRLIMNKGNLEVEGDYTVLNNSYSYLQMTNDEDYIHVHGDVSMDAWGEADSWLIAGTFEVKGNFSAKKGLRASKNHRVLFSGDKKQTITVADGECFATVELANHSAEGVYSEEPFNNHNFITNGCKMTYGEYTGEYGWMLEEDQVYEGDLILIEDVLDLNGHTLTVTGDIVQLSGSILVNEGKLIVKGDYHMQSRKETGADYIYGKSSGHLKMLNETDSVCVEGSFISSSIIDSTDDLIAGTMEIKGDVEIDAAYSDKGFVASGSHTLILSGEESQKVSFGKSSNSTSRLANLDICNTSAAGVVFLSDADHKNAVYVSGTVKDTAKKVTGFIAIGSTTGFGDNAFGGSVFIGEKAALKQDVIIEGDMELVANNDVSLYGNVVVKGNLFQNQTRLYMQKNSLTVYGDYTVGQNSPSALYMTHAEDYIHVHGDVTYNPYYTGQNYLSAGTFEIGGNLTSKQGIQAHNTHRFLFSGTEKQTISIASNEYFATVELANESDEGVYSETTFAKQELITNGCRITYGDLQGEYGWTLTEDSVYEGDLVLIEDTLDLNGHSLTVTGDLVQLSGTVFVNGGSLTVEGDYRIQFREGGADGKEYTYGTSSGYLKMTNAADKVCVKGSYISDSSVTGTDYLTAGTLEIQGDFLVNSTVSQKSFIATGSHTVLLSGSAKQTVQFGASSYANARLGNLEITNAGEDGVVFVSTEKTIEGKTYHENVIYISGNINDHHNHVTGVIGIGADTTFADNYFGGGININQTIKWDNELHVKGDMELIGSADLTIWGSLVVEGNLIQTSGRLYMHQGRLEVFGDYSLLNRAYSRLGMYYPEDYIHVHGNVIYKPYYGGSSYLTAGTFEIGGDFTSTTGLQASGTHKFLFSGDRLQTISIAENEYFAIVELQNHSAEGVYSAVMFNSQKVITNGCRITYGDFTGEYGWTLEEDMVYEGDLVLIEDTLDLNGHSLTVTGDLVQLSGTVFINGGTLTVEGDYRVQSRKSAAGGGESDYVYGKSSGHLQMVNTADKVCVKGSYISDSSATETDYLTAGTLEVQGDFLVNSTASQKSFIATGSHTVLLSGNAKQTVQFGASSYTNARLNNLEITNASEDGVVFVSTEKTTEGKSYHEKVIYISGNINDHHNQVTGVIGIGAETTFTDNYFGGGINIDQTIKWDKELHVKGDVELTGWLKELTIWGSLVVEGDFIQTAGRLSMHQGNLEIFGDYSVLYVKESRLGMYYPEDYIHVHGDVIYKPYNEGKGYLTAGTFEVGGNFTSTRGLQASGTHKFLFSGDGLQTVSIASNEYFATVEIANYSDQGVYFENVFQKTTLIRNGCKMRIGDLEGEYGWTLTEDEVYEGDLILLEDTLDLNGHTLTVNGDLIQTSGTVFVNGGKLNISGDYRLQTCRGEEGSYSYTESTGCLVMTNKSDYITVQGDFVLQTRESLQGQLTAGTLEVKGSFTQTGTNAYLGTEANILIFSGDKAQTWSQEKAGTVGNVVNRSARKLTIKNDATVYGTLTDEKDTVTGDGYLSIADISQLVQGNWSGNILLTGKSVLEQTLQTGTLKINTNASLRTDGHFITADAIIADGRLEVESADISCIGDFTVLKNGSLVMQDSLGYLLVGGNFLISSQYNHSGLLTAGTLEIRGHFTQQDYTNFVASDEHIVILARKQTLSGRNFIQSVIFNSNAGTTRFNKLILRKNLKNYQFKNDVYSIANEVIFEIEDETAPVPVSYIKASEVTVSTVTLTYGGSSDDAGLLGYEIYRDGKQIGVTGGTSYQDTGLEPEKTYTYTVYPFDIYRNLTTESPRCEVTTPADEEKPSAPSGAAISTRTGSSITLAWNPATDNVGVSSYGVYRDGQEIAKNISSTQYQDKNLAMNTVYRYTIVAYDTSGNVSAESNTVEAAVAVPRITEITPADYSAVGQGAVPITVKFADSGNSKGNRVKIEYLEEDEWKLLTYLTQKTYNASTLYVSYDWSPSNVQEKENYQLRITLYDADQNTDVREVEYRVDTQAPQLPEKFSAEADNGTVSLLWDASKSADCAVYKLYRKEAAADEEEQEPDYKLLARLEGRYKQTYYVDQAVTEGKTYSYALTVEDAFGNTSEFTEPVTVTVDTDKEPPKVKNITPGAGRIAQTTEISVAAEDNCRVAAVRLSYRREDVEEWTYLTEVRAADGSAVYQWDTTALADGVYVFNAVAVDGNGNESTTEFTRRYEVDNTGIQKIKITDTRVISTAVQLQWEDVTETDFAYFQVEQRVGESYVKIAEVSDALGYNVTGLSPGMNYNFRVVGYDNLGNRGIESDIMTITTEADTILPVIREIYPVEGHYKDALELKLTASDNDMVAKAVFSASLDGTAYEEIAVLENTQKTQQTRFSYRYDLATLPEGMLYIKFEAYDRAGNKNALNSAGKEIVLEYQIDRTAPAKVKGLTENGTEGYVGLCWEDVADQDVESFKIYRMDGDHGIFKVIQSACTTKNYYDTSVKAGTSYTYKVSAVDAAGNEGECSKEICVSVKEDRESPVITGISPADKSTVGKNPVLKLAATDNAGLASVAVSYKKADSREEIWTQIGKVSLSGRGDLASVTWNTEELEEGSYIVRAVAYDLKGNASEIYQAAYTLDMTAPAVPKVTAATGHFEIKLQIEGGTETDFDHFEINRRVAGETNWEKVAKITDKSYIDAAVKANQVYFYQVSAYDKYGNASISEETEGFADDVDEIVPVADLPENMVGLVGMELAFDGCGSTDNVRVTRYEWDMGNGDKRTGAQFVYTYKEAGTYTVTLKVSDAAGNSAKTAMVVRIYEKTGRGIYHLTVTDEQGNPLPYAAVYVNNSLETISLKADSTGYLTFVGVVGMHRLAAYGAGYLPEETSIRLSEYEEGEGTIKLRKDSLIVGDISVRRMTLEEMAEAGVDFSDPENMHTFSFSVDLTFVEKPRKVVGLKFGQPFELKWKDGEHEPGGDGHILNIQGIPFPDNGGGKQAEQREKPKLILAYISTSESVSWLKDMYEVQLGILNAADSQFVLADAVATLNLPEDGVSLAKTVYGQKRTQSMGDIAGQQRQSVSWIVKGDKSGSYKLSADFAGTLMPFEEPVSAHFETKGSFNVTTGEGLCIYVMPETTAYVDMTYYIQYQVVNESNKPFYNFTTSIGSFEAPTSAYMMQDQETGWVLDQQFRTITVSDPSTISQSLVVQDGQKIMFETLYPGQVYYGTYKKTFEQSPDSDADPNKIYYELIDTLIETMEGENLGVEIRTHYIPGHISYVFGKIVPTPAFYGDPIDISRGSFTESVSAMTVKGATDLSVNFSYDSLLTDEAGELGYGWKHDFEYSVEENCGTISFHLSPTAYAYFVKQDALANYFEGQQTQDGAILAKGKHLSYGTYACLSAGMTDYVLVKNKNDTYTITAPSGMKFDFDSAGKLVKQTDENGKTISISHSAGKTTITENISGKHLYLNYNDEGLMTSVTDDNGRKTSLSYDKDKNLTAVTNALGETVYYHYDNKHRITSEVGSEGTIVQNVYDGKGRVVKQTDADGNAMTLEYTAEGRNTKVTIHDMDGSTKYALVDARNQIIQNTNADGSSVRYTYDNNGNLTSQVDAQENAIFNVYDKKNRMISFTDTGNLTTDMTYDAHGNLLTIRGTKDRNASYTYDSRNLMTSQTDAMGLKTAYAYDANGQLIKETIPGLGTTEYTYHKGMISSVKDYNGNVTKLAYDGMGNLIRSTDSQGNTKENTYDAIGHLLTSKDAMGNVTSYTYDYVGNLTSVTDALGNRTAFTYDKAGRLTKETYPDGTSIKYTYDVMGNCIQKSFADGTSESYTYDSVGNVTGTVLADGSEISCSYDSLGHKVSETDSAGNTAYYTYYPNGNLQKVTYPDGSTEIYSYDQAWKLMELTDRSGASTHYEYDAGGNMTLQRDGLGNTWKYDYDQYGRLTSETDANGNTTKYSYDSNGNCIRKTDAAGVSAYMEYDSLNRMTKAYTKTSDGEVYSISYTYDALGRVTSSTDEMGYTTRMSYDASGNLLSITDAAGIVTMTATYDSMGRTSTVKDALGVTTAYSYDTMGNLLQAVETLNAENSRETTYTYDALGRTTSVTDPLQGVTQAAYDRQGNVSSVTDANGGVTKYQYDKMGQLAAEISPLGSKTSYTYNAAGLLTESQNARKQNTAYIYDKAGRITSMTDELGTTEYTYDANGNILTVTDAQGTITREYDALNRVTKYTDARGNTVRYGYDEIGNLIYLTYPGGEIVRCSYYKNGWLETVTDPAGKVTKYSYDARGNLTCTERPNGTKETCTYNDAGLLLTQNDTRGEEVLTAYSYTYDESGNIIAISGTGTTDTQEGISALSGATMTYDAENRLLTYNGEEIRYDADGNMTYGPVNGVMSELVYDCRNRLVSAGGVTYTYDAENNRIAMESDRHKETYV